MEREGDENHVQEIGHDADCGLVGVWEHESDDNHVREIGHDADCGLDSVSL